MINNDVIKSILQSKKVTNLYHANTVSTAFTFLRYDGLLSREYVDKHGLFQTNQSSDQNDIAVGVYNDIFFDSVDIHERAKEYNVYGPVLFVYSLDVLNTISDGRIAITKSNPGYWQVNLPECDRYFQTADELNREYFRGRFEQHLTIRNQNTPLSFDYLEKIVLDNPFLNDDYILDIRNKMINILSHTGRHIDIEIRICTKECVKQCKKSYSVCDEAEMAHFFALNW